jgi:hypothetical protein
MRSDRASGVNGRIHCSGSFTSGRASLLAPSEETARARESLIQLRALTHAGSEMSEAGGYGDHFQMLLPDDMVGSPQPATIVEHLRLVRNAQLRRWRERAGRSIFRREMHGPPPQRARTGAGCSPGSPAH